MQVQREVLLHTDNPCYKQLAEKYPHLQEAVIDDDDTKAKLPIHLVLGGGEFARIKTPTCTLVGKEGEPVAKLTKLGWVIMSLGQQLSQNRILLTQTTHKDYVELCRLDVLGLPDGREHDQAYIHTEFKEQLSRDESGFYETSLPWLGNHPPLPDNKVGAERRLKQLERKLEKQGPTVRYDKVIKDQLAQGIVEFASEEAVGKVCYIPRGPVVREGAELTTKLRVVYDASAKATADSPSLNECLNPGPTLQNRLFHVLTRNRARCVALCGDIKQAFLQIRIREEERDALRFLWDGTTYCFTRALFGLNSSPFLLNGVLKEHFETWASREPQAVAELQSSTYVDDVLSGGSHVSEVQDLKNTTKKIFADAGFTLHKWNSNVSELEDLPLLSEEQTFAKVQLGVGVHETKLLGLLWDKELDTLKVSFPRLNLCVQNGDC